MFSNYKSIVPYIYYLFITPLVGCLSVCCLPTDETVLQQKYKGPEDAASRHTSDTSFATKTMLLKTTRKNDTRSQIPYWTQMQDTSTLLPAQLSSQCLLYPWQQNSCIPPRPLGLSCFLPLWSQVIPHTPLHCWRSSHCSDRGLYFPSQVHMMLGKSAKQTGTGDDKWNQPGWRIEQRYANKVLIGNWAEERLQVRSFI